MDGYRRIRMGREKRIACIAHDNKKSELVEWMRFNRQLLQEHCLYATRTTGALIARDLGLPVTTFHSGPLGGDLEIGARIARGSLDFLIFFWDPLEPLPTIRTSARCCESPPSGTSPSRATGRRRTSWCPRR